MNPQTPPEATNQNQNNQPPLSDPLPLQQTPVNPTVIPPEPQLVPAKKSRKKLIIAVILVIIVMLAGAGFVFGYYLPNRPENVWKTSVNRTGKAFDGLVNEATDQTRIEQYKKSDITIKLDATYAETNKYKGTLNVKFDESKVNGQLDVSFDDDGAVMHNIKANLLAEMPDGAIYPTIYAKASGLTSLIQEGLLPQSVAKYDDKWIFVDQDFWKELNVAPEQLEEQRRQTLTSADYAELAKAAARPTLEYVFTTEPNKAVFQNKGFIRKEKVDNKDTYVYKVGLSKANLRTYCRAMVESLVATDAFKKLPGANNQNTVDQYKTSALASCDESFKDLDESKTYELWVDKKYKLIYKIRIPDTGNKDAYTEYGQNYDGGDSVTFFINKQSKDSQGNFTLEMNTQSSTTKGTINYRGKQFETPYNITVSLEAKPHNEEIVVEKPASAIPLQQVLKDLGLPIQQNL